MKSVLGTWEEPGLEWVTLRKVDDRNPVKADLVVTDGEREYGAYRKGRALLVGRQLFWPNIGPDLVPVNWYAWTSLERMTRVER